MDRIAYHLFSSSILNVKGLKTRHLFDSSTFLGNLYRASFAKNNTGHSSIQLANARSYPSDLAGRADRATRPSILREECDVNEPAHDDARAQNYTWCRRVLR